MTKKLKATLKRQRNLKVRSDPFSVIKMESLLDVDTTTKENGSVLVYSDQTEKWEATRLLDNQFIEGGHY